MYPQDLILRCYARKLPNDQWYAICLDLNLFAQDDSLEDVKKKLNSMIEDYVFEACTSDSKYFNDLIPRKAPFHFFAAYKLFQLLSKFDHLLKKLKVFLYFDHVPMIPAHGK